MMSDKQRIFSVLCFSIFTTVTGVGIVVPLLPVYARQLGASGFFIGMIFGVFSISRTVALPWFGALSDRKGRKPFVVVGMISYTIVSFAFMAAHTVGLLLVIRFFQGIASAMLMPVLQAYVGEIVPGGRESTWMGTFNMSIFLGLSLGPVIGGWMNQRWGMDAAFVSMGLLAFAGFLLSLFFLPPTASEPLMQNPQHLGQTWRKVIKNRRVASLFAYRFAYTACIGVIWGFLPLYLDTALGFGSSVIGLIVTTGVLVSGVIQTPMGWFADGISDKRWLVAAGGACAALALWGYRWADSEMGFIAVSVLFGLGGGMSMPALMGLAVEEGIRLQAMGSVMSLLTMGHSIGMLAGALVAGLLMDLASLDSAFAAGALFLAVGLCLFWVLGSPTAREGPVDRL
jgi:MFS family permease